MITSQPIKFDPNNKSNFPSENNFVIQGFNGGGWQDSKYSSHTVKQAIELAGTLDMCMSENTILRVVHCCEKK